MYIVTGATSAVSTDSIATPPSARSVPPQPRRVGASASVATRPSSLGTISIDIVSTKIHSSASGPPLAERPMASASRRSWPEPSAACAIGMARPTSISMAQIGDTRYCTMPLPRCRRLTQCRPRAPMTPPCCRLPWHQRRSRSSMSPSDGGPSSKLPSSPGSRCSAQPPRRSSAASTKSWLSTAPAKGLRPFSSGRPADAAKAAVRMMALCPQ